jgi:hypothetical protein
MVTMSPTMYEKIYSGSEKTEVFPDFSDVEQIAKKLYTKVEKILSFSSLITADQSCCLVLFYGEHFS